MRAGRIGEESRGSYWCRLGDASRVIVGCGEDLNAEMVRAGMAIDWPKFSRGKYSGLELPGIRKKLWRCDARQKGLMPPSLPD